MSEVVKKPLKITETVLRDAHQSLIAYEDGCGQQQDTGIQFSF